MLVMGNGPSLEEMRVTCRKFARAALSSRDIPAKTLRDIEQSKVCFNCVRVRFGYLFGARWIRCFMCDQCFCDACVNKITLPSPSPLKTIRLKSYVGESMLSVDQGSFEQSMRHSPALGKAGKLVKVCRNCSDLVKHVVSGTPNSSRCSSPLI